MNESAQEQQIKQLRAMWEWRSTEELLDVWQQNNHNEWRDEVFEVIGQILLTRLETIPPQGEPASSAPPPTKRTTKWIFLAVALIAVLGAAYLLLFRSNWHVDVMRDENQTIALTRSSNPKRLVYENDVVQISIGYDQFLDYIETQLRDPEATSAMQKSDKEWLAQVELELSKGDVVKLTEYRIEFFVANMLETGQAAVFDKRSQSYVDAIRWRTYEFVCGTFCGGGFYEFYLLDTGLFNSTGTQFLTVQYMEF
jgi:hypothetical protein